MDSHVAQFMTTAHVVLSLLLFFVQFSRATKTSRSTRPAILLSFWMLTAASVVSLFAPIVFPGWNPSFETLLLLAAISAVQFVTARYWQDGTPSHFCNEHDLPKPRAMG